MARQLNTSINEFPLPESLSAEMQVIADIISNPETLIDAEKMLTSEMFTDELCKNAFAALRAMAKEGMVIDLPSAFGRIDRGLMQKGVIPMMQNSGGAVTALQHYATLKDYNLRRKCYFAAVNMLTNACSPQTTPQDLITQADRFAQEVRKEIDTEKGTQHISQVLIELGETLEGIQRDRQMGKKLRTPTGFSELNFYTYGGFNAGNLVILAARPSVGKTAVMLQMAKSAAEAGKIANIFSLEMTNQELAQRFLLSESDDLNQWRMVMGDIEWSAYEKASGSLSSKPIYLNDSARTIEDITQRITLNAMAGKCDIAFIDYLGLIQLPKSNNLSQAIAECTKGLKILAKTCKIPIVLLCQLNRASASEKRAPEMYDLRDSGGIEQDADIVLMLERAGEDSEGREVNMWVRKNRQGKAGDVKVEIVGNETFTAFTDKNAPAPPPMSSQTWVSDFDNDDSDIPF